MKTKSRTKERPTAAQPALGPASGSRGVVYWAVIGPCGRPWPTGISPNRTCAIRKFLEMPINTPPGSGRAEMQRRLWAQKKRQGFWLTRVRITSANRQ